MVALSSGTAPARPSFAVIGRNIDAFVEVLQGFGRCVTFPSLAHFRDAPGEPWSGVLIAREGAFDRNLERVRKAGAVLARWGSGSDAEYDWPPEILRIETLDDLRSWAGACEAPSSAISEVRTRDAAGGAHDAEVDEDLARPSRVAPRGGQRARNTTSAPPTGTHERSMALRVPDGNMRRPSEVVVLTSDPAVRVEISSVLRGVRPIRYVVSARDLPRVEPERVLALIVADATVDLTGLEPYARTPETLARFGHFGDVAADAGVNAAKRLTSPTALRDFISFALAFEYTGDLAFARELTGMIPLGRAAMSLRIIELCAVRAWNVSRSERARVVGVSEETAKDYDKRMLREFGAPARRIVEEALAAAGRLELRPPSWLEIESGPELSPWRSLCERLPRDVLEFDASLVRWPDHLGDLLERMREGNDGGSSTVRDVLARGESELGAEHTSERACDVLEKLLVAAPATAFERAAKEQRKREQALSRAPSARPSQRSVPITEASGRDAVSTRSPSPSGDPELLLARVEGVLRAAGAPMTREELTAALGASTGEALYRMVGRPPFVECDTRHWGLVDRDLPGGLVAFDTALSALRTMAGQSTSEVEPRVRALSGEHARWSGQMIATAVRCVRGEATRASELAQSRAKSLLPSEPALRSSRPREAKLEMVRLRPPEAYGATRAQRARQLVADAETVLREAGRPLTRQEFARVLGSLADEALSFMADLPTFVECDATHWGLVERDVPGGRHAFGKALAYLRTHGSADALRAISELSPDHAKWSPEMIATAIRCVREDEV